MSGVQLSGGFFVLSKRQLFTRWWARWSVGDGSATMTVILVVVLKRWFVVGWWWMVGCRRSLWLCRIEPGLAVPKLRFNWVAVEDSWEEVAREVQLLSVQQCREHVYWHSFCLIGNMFSNDIKDSCEMISDSTLYRWFNSTQFLKVFSSCKRWWPGDLLCCWLMLDQRIRNSNAGISLLIIP